jgi:hypothetical protein
MKRAGLLVTIAVVGSMVLAPGAGAAPVAVAGYDVSITPEAGFGTWSHTYTGTITDTGRIVGSQFGCPTCHYVSEQGGGGTLNDGIVPTTVDNDQLLIVGADAVGNRVDPAITIHLATTARVQQIRLSGGDILANFFPGIITGASVTIDGATVPLTSIPAGIPNAVGTPEDDILDLTGTPLATTATDTVTIGGFTADPAGGGQFVIGEITVDGVAVEPVTAATLCDRTRAVVTGGAAYQALPNKRRSQVDKLVAKACDAARDITAKGTTPAKKARLVADFKRAIEDLRAGGWLTGGDAADIDALADQV